MKCKNCPCADICLSWPIFCEMAAKSPQIELEIKHICNRSSIGVKPQGKQNADRFMPDKVVMSTGNGSMATIPASESIQLSKEMNACPNYKRDSKCGCGLARCMIGKGKPDPNQEGTGLVSNWDCYHCLRPDVALYSDHAYKKGL